MAGRELSFLQVNSASLAHAWAKFEAKQRAWREESSWLSFISCGLKRLPLPTSPKAKGGLKASICKGFASDAGVKDGP